MFSLSSSPVSREQTVKLLQNEKAGALVLFEGWVRNHNEGKNVTSLEYQVYEELAQKEGEKILAEAKNKFNLHEAVCIHRYGHLSLGDAAVIVGATASHRDDAFKAARYIIDEIKHRLPIWKKEHYESKTPEWVYCKDHHNHVHFCESDYYAKQSGLVSQQMLKDARVLVIGAGGLGCPVLTSLAAAGVGHIDIADFDRISISNIHRQPLYSPHLAGEYKAVVAKTKLSELNPFIHIHSHTDRVDAGNVENFFSGKTLVIDCTDNLETKFLLHDACFKTGVPLISASVYRFEGQVRSFVPQLKNGCLRCTYQSTPDDALMGNCNDFGVLASAVGTIGSLQANESILFLTAGKNNTTDTTLYFDLKNLSQMQIKNSKKSGCEVCEGLVKLELNNIEVSTESLSEDFELVDIREQQDSYLDPWKLSSKKVAVYCHRGVRSKKLVTDLRSQGFTNFYSVRGGACSL